MSKTRYEISQKQLVQISNNFSYHRPTPDQIPAYEDIRNKAKEFALYLATQVPESRELSLAMTQLEQCVIWANAGIARNEK